MLMSEVISVHQTVQDSIGKLLLITTKTSRMAFRLVQKSVTLNDLERCNGRVVCVISPNSLAFRTY